MNIRDINLSAPSSSDQARICYVGQLVTISTSVAKKPLQISILLALTSDDHAFVMTLGMEDSHENGNGKFPPKVREPHA